MEEIGKVIKTDKNFATVKIDLPSNCESCEFSNFCRIDKNAREIICRNDKGAKTGDIVKIGTTKRNFYIATILNFILPLLLLIGGVIIGKILWQSDLAGFLSGMFLMVFYFLVFLFIDKYLLKRGRLVPEIIDIKGKQESV